MTEREKRSATETGDRTGFQPYNIWKPMDPRLRRRLAFAVFLTFAAIGPLSILMNPSVRSVTPLYVLLATAGSGGISASIILFGRRLYLLVPAVALCVLIVSRAHDWTTTGDVPRPEPRATIVPAGAFPETARVGIGALAIGLIAAGYTAFIIVLSTEGRRRTVLETEVGIARRIQQSLLPPEVVSTPAGEASGRTIPASEVGGDFFDILPLPGDRMLLFLADVAGHGIGAGILAAMTKSAVHLQASLDPSPGAVLTALNTTLQEVADRRMFVTAACVLFDRRTHELRASTAGHPPILLFREGKILRLRTPALALGMKENVRFEETSSPAGAGDAVLLYSDGIVERTNSADAQYDLAGVEGIFTSAAHLPAAQIASAVLEDNDRFGGRITRKDDLTVLASRLG